jgi:hypothetical protein
MRSLGGEREGGEEGEEGSEECDTEWSLNRECELARLEKENEMLRRMVGLPVASDGDEHVSEERRASVPSNTGIARQGRMLGGQAGTVGPFGTYKRLRAG